MYTIYLDLDEFLRAAHDAAATTIHLQESIRTRYSGGVPYFESVLLLTAQLASDHIIAARIPLERADALIQPDAMYAAMQERAQRILASLWQEITQLGIVPQPGLALLPGLLDDLHKTDCSAGERWRIIELDRGDPRSRTLEFKETTDQC